MRKVKFWFSSDGKAEQGYFHQWIVCSSYAEQGAVVRVFAIIEKHSGEIHLIEPNKIRFVS